MQTEEPVNDEPEKRYGRKAGQIVIEFNCKLYRYRIRVTRRYCGASVTCILPRPGEDWVRGNDLKDGPLWRLPWIIKDVIDHIRNKGRWTGNKRTDSQVSK